MFSRQTTTVVAPHALRKLGWGVALAFTLKGLVTTGLIVLAALKTLDVF